MTRGRFRVLLLAASALASGALSPPAAAQDRGENGGEDGGGDAGGAPAAEDPVERLAAEAEQLRGEARADAFTRLATALEEAARWYEAAGAWREVAAVRPTAASAEREGRALLAFAEELLAAQEPGSSIRAAFADAASALRRARKLGSKDLAVRLGIARCLAADGLADDQIRELRAACDDFPGDPAPPRALAFALYHAGRTAEAIAALAPLSEAAPSDIALSLTLADCARAAKDEALALLAAERTIRAHPQDRRGWEAVWKVYAAERRWGELADRLAQHADAAPEAARAAHYAGFAASSAQRWDAALAYLGRAWKLDPKDADAQVQRARILSQHRNDREGAAAALREVLRTVPDHRGAIEVMSFLCAQRDRDGDYAGAVADLELLVAYRPEDPVLLANLALEQRWAGRNADAEHSYLAAIGLAPSDPVLRNDLGLLYLVEGRDADARRTFEAGVAADPEFNDNLENLGFMARRDGRTAESLTWYGRALAAAARKGADTSRHRRNTDDVRFPLPPLGSPR